MKTVLKITVLVFFALTTTSFTHGQQANPKVAPVNPSLHTKEVWWEVQSIDTMKYSRDIAREKATDPDFVEEIDEQVKNIASTGANYVAIATPYDKEFIPFLTKWVDAARKYNLRVWFRGNFSGWEQWFDYPKITREEHIKKSVEFVKENRHLFKHGDIFSACPECENGGPGDPRLNGDVAGHRQFLIDEYSAIKKTMTDLGLNVDANYNPMNGDVAKLIMDKETTKSLGGLVVIDHYVKTPEKLNDDINKIAEMSGGKVFLGEFGAPITDIHGEFTEIQQAEWISRSLELLARNTNLKGLNYWVNKGGSTQLWGSKNYARPAVSVITKFFTPDVSIGLVKNEIGQPIRNATISSDYKMAVSDNRGYFFIPYLENENKVTIKANGYDSEEYYLLPYMENNVVLQKIQENILFKIQRFFYKLFSKEDQR